MNNNITAIILVALAIGTYLTFTRAKLAEVNEVRVVNTQYLSAIDSADRLIKVRDAVLKDYNALSSEDRDRLDKMLPNTVDNIRLIIDLNSVALRHGFSLRDIKAAASKKPAAEPPGLFQHPLSAESSKPSTGTVRGSRPVGSP